VREKRENALFNTFVRGASLLVAVPLAFFLGRLLVGGVLAAFPA